MLMNDGFTEEEQKQVQSLFVNLGADSAQAGVMSRQLLKRASQLSSERGITRLEALQELLNRIISVREDQSSANDAY